jgi:hypothetical protein
MSDQLVHDPSGEVDWDAEPHSFVSPAVGRNRVVNSDHLALHVDQRPTRVAGIDRGVSLKKILVQHVGKLFQLPAACADDSLAH